MTNTSAAEPVGPMPSGRPPETTPDEALAVFRDRDDPAAPMTASEVNDRLHCSKRTTLRLLDQLADDGRLESKPVGARAKVWWLPPAERPAQGADDGDAHAGREAPPAAADETADRSPADDPRRDDGPSTTPRETSDDGDDRDAADEVSPDDERVRAVVDAVAAGAVEIDDEYVGWDDDGRLDDRKAAARAVLAYALETGDHISKSDAVDGFRDQFPVPGQNAETWWRTNVRVVLRAVGNHRRGVGYRVDPERVDAISDRE